MDRSAGWISPKGVFYPCESYGHHESAIEICLEHYQREYIMRGHPDQILEQKGWVHLWKDGTPMVHYTSIYKGITQPQIDTLSDMAVQWGEPYASRILTFLDEEFEYRSLVV